MQEKMQEEKDNITAKISFHKEKLDIMNMTVPNAILVGAFIISLAVIIGSFIIKSNFSINGSKNNLLAQDSTLDQGNIKAEERSDSPKIGGGKVVIQEFSDFQCPFCKAFFNSAYKEIKAKYIDTGKVTFIYRHFPLSFHQNAQKAAEASECAHDQNKFWEYYDLLFTRGEADGKGLSVQDLKRYALELGLNVSTFNSCLDTGAKASVVQADFDAGQKAGVEGTPTFSINGKKVVGNLPYSEFEKIIEEALK